MIRDFHRGQGPPARWSPAELLTPAQGLMPWSHPHLVQPSYPWSEHSTVEVSSHPDQVWCLRGPPRLHVKFKVLSRSSRLFMSLSQLNRPLPPLHAQKSVATHPPPYPHASAPGTPRMPDCLSTSLFSPAHRLCTQETHHPSLRAPSPRVPLWTHSPSPLLSCELCEDAGLSPRWPQGQQGLPAQQGLGRR